MTKFAPPKSRRPTKLCAPMLFTKSMETTTTTTTASFENARAADATTMLASTCRTCKRWGLPCPFCVQSTPQLSPIKSDWSDENWDGDKQREQQAKKREQQNQQKKEDLTKDYCPSRPMYDPTFKQDPLPHCTPKEKLTFDPNYYPQGYIPKEEEARLLVNNLVTSPEKRPIRRKGGEERRGDKRQRSRGQKRINRDTSRPRTGCR